MALERSTVFEAPFLGAESLADPGVAVAALKQLESIGFARKPRMENTPFTPKGSKVPTIMVPGKEWTEWSIDGVADFNNIVYPLASVISYPSIATPGGATNVRDWTFRSSHNAPDTPQTYTIDVGSAVRADRASFVFFTEFGLTWTRDQVTLSGAAVGQRMTDNVNLAGLNVWSIQLDSGSVSGGTFEVDVDGQATNVAFDATAAELQDAIGGLSTVGRSNVLVTGGPLGTAAFVVKFFGSLFGTGVTLAVDDALLTGTTPVASATETQAATAVSTVAAIPVAPGNTSLFIDTTSAGLGASRELRIMQADLRIASRREMLWVIDANQASFANCYETPIDATLKVKMVADGAGMAYLQKARDADTNFVRIESTGAAFAAPDGAFNRRLRVDAAGKIEMPDDFGGEGVATVDWSLRLVEDATWDNWISVEARNSLTAL